MDLINASKNIRLNILRLANKSKFVGAHIAPSLSIVEILTAIICCNFDFNTDKFVLSKGHAGLAYYCALKETGLITDEQLNTFENNGGEFPGQPTKTKDNTVIYASGSLGLGLSYACGLALAKKIRKDNGKIYVLLGNGELNEGSNYESLMFIVAHELNNIIIIVDDNKMQSDGNTDSVLKMNICNITNGFGFNIIICDGHNVKSIDKSIKEASNKCSIIIANTIKGKGVSFMENNNDWHHAILNDEQYKKARDEVLNG